MKKQQNIKLSDDSTYNQNGASERAIKKVVTTTSTTMMHAVLICPKVTIYIKYFQWKWTILYGYTVGYLICSTVYQSLENNQEQG